MERLLIHVEGETEEEFVREVLAEHLRSFGYSSVSARLLGNSRPRASRGGIRAWDAAKKDIVRHLKEDTGCLATTMVDYYGLRKSWPGRAEAGQLPFGQKARCVEDALLADIAQARGHRFDSRRFMPFVMLHEFEGMLFSDCDAFAKAIGKPHLASAFQATRNQFSTPEEINDSPNTAPSKRVQQIFAGYDKPFHGPLAVLEIGLETIRVQCPHFNDWITRLETCPRLGISLR